MGLTHDQVSVGETATVIVASDATEHRRVWVHDPTGGASVFVGDSTVTTSNGFELEAGESQSFDIEPGEALYGIVASGTQTVSYFAA